jgi:crotonobetaine/carnitine-CoA ligase
MRTPLEVLRLYRDHDYSLRDLVESRAERERDRPLIWFDGVESSWAEVQRRAAGAAAALAAQGVKHGDRIAIMARNSPDHLILLLALGRLGAIMVPVNPEFGAEETRFVLDHADVGGVLASAETIGTVRAAVAEMNPKPWLVSLDGADAETPAFADLIAAGRGLPVPNAGKADDAVIIIFTSGSTGFPKAVLHSQRNFLTAGEAFISRVRLQETDRLMIVLPMYHINAVFYSVAGTLAAGASMAIVPKFSASRFWEVAVDSGATEANVIEAMGAILKERQRSEFRPEHRIRAIYGVRPWLIETFNKEFHVPTCVGGYGMSEIPGVISTPLDRPNAPGSMGVVGSHPDPARPWAECRVVDDDGRDLGDDQVGELLVRTPIVMKGYFRDPEQTDAAFVDGWFRTGDLVRRDKDGFYTFVSRKKDIIRRRGENISGAEIDRIVMEHPGVEQVAAIAVPAALGEDDILVAVVKRQGAMVEASEIADWCAERLAPMKVPRYVAFLDRLPYTPTSKINKNALREDKTLVACATDFGDRTRRPPKRSA